MVNRRRARWIDKLAAQDADRVITLCDIRGRLIARHDLRPEQGDPEIAS
jgi:hypothetical protein